MTLTPQREPAIPNGAYTLLKNGFEPFTLKVHTVRQSGAAFDGKTVISFYDRTANNWVSFAFLGDDDLIHVWKRFYDEPDLKAAAEALLNPDVRTVADARYRASLER